MTSRSLSSCWTRHVSETTERHLSPLASRTGDQGTHSESKNNFHQLLTLRCKDDNSLKTWLLQNKYMSPEIVNECILLMSKCVDRRTLNTIHDVKLFAILGDETRDIQNREQLAITKYSMGGG